MPDRMYAKIEIGGKFPLSKIDALAKLLDDETSEGHQSREDIVMAYLDGECVEARNPETSGGQFDDLEGWLKEHKIIHIRTTDPYLEYDGEINYFDGVELIYQLCDSNHNPYVHLASLKESLKDGETLEDIIKELDKIPECPVLELVDDTGETIEKKEFGTVKPLIVRHKELEEKKQAG